MQDVLNDEAVGQLRGDDRVLEFLGHHRLDVVLWRHLRRVFGIPRHASGDQEVPQVVFADQILACVIDAPRQSQATFGRIHRDVDAVERITSRIVRADTPMIADVVEGVLVIPVILADDQTR